MRSLQESPSQLINQSVLSKSPSGNGLTNRHNSGLKDPSSITLNINRKFEKLVTQTNDGSQIKFFAHHAEKPSHRRGSGARHKSLGGNYSVRRNQQAAKTIGHDEKETLMMKRYEKELNFKNRVIKEKEK